MSRTRLSHVGDSLSRIAKRFYEIHDDQGRVSEQRYELVFEALRAANRSLNLNGSLLPGTRVTLPDVESLGPIDAVHIASRESFRQQVEKICERVNRDEALPAAYLVDPARALEDLDYSFEESVRRRLLRTTLGYSVAQSDAYDQVAVAGHLAGFERVTLRPHGGPRRQRDNRHSAVASETAGNPLGNYDTVFDLSEAVVEGVLQTAYDEGAFDHRVSLSGNQSGTELLIGRPTSLVFDTQRPNGVRLSCPFAVIMGSQNKVGKITIEAGIKTLETQGKPTHVAVDPSTTPTVSIQSKDLTPAEITLYEGLVKLHLLPHVAKAPLSPVLQPIQKVGAFLKIEITDMDVKVHNAGPASALDSLAVCLDFSPNDGAGKVANVTQFATSDWAVGASERALKQKFNEWWASTEAQQFRRLDRDKVENFKTLPKEKRGEIFDANGDIQIGNVEFYVKKDVISFAVDVTLENEFLWFDVDATLTGDLTLNVNKKNQLTITISNVNSSVSCWSKFLIALFCTFLGLVAGGILGAIIGGVIGSVVGVTAGAAIGVSIGASVGTVVGMIVGVALPVVAEALIQDKLNALQDIAILDLAYDWQLPGSTKTVSALAFWVKVLPGEVLVGGKAQLPAKAATTASIAAKTLTRTEVPVALPWISDEQLAKLGSAPSYFVHSIMKYMVQADSGLEKPFDCIWKVGGKKLDGVGEAIEVVITPSLAYVVKPEPAPMGSKVPKKNITAAIRVDRTIRVIKSSGGKGAPLVLTEFVPGPVSYFATLTPLTVEITDAVRTSASAQLDASIPVLGDYLYDWWAKNKHKYMAALHPDELVGSGIVRFPGGGLLPPDEIFGQWRSEFLTDPRPRQAASVGNAILALNIEGAELLEERGVDLYVKPEVLGPGT